MPNKKGQATRSRIIDSGLNVLLEEGSSNISLRQVANAAGITPMAIYRHFDDKDSLELALLERAFALFESYLTESSKDGSPRENLLALAERFFDFALEREAHFRFLFLDDTRPATGGRGSAVRTISRPTFLILRDAIEDYLRHEAVAADDLNDLTTDALAFCIGRVALLVSGNLSYAKRERKGRLVKAFERYVDLMSRP